MTMAKVEKGAVTAIRLPSDLANQSLNKLKQIGWYPVEGTPKPTEPTEPGYRWEYSAEWSFNDNKVYGTWKTKQRPQSYPSWSWVDGEGWVPPTPKPDGDYTWDEESQSWVDDKL
jgi:hypothetical protein